MIELNHVTKYINDTIAIDNVTAHITEGKSYGILEFMDSGTNRIAPNGAN